MFGEKQFVRPSADVSYDGVEPQIMGNPTNGDLVETLEKFVDADQRLWLEFPRSLEAKGYIIKHRVYMGAGRREMKLCIQSQKGRGSPYAIPIAEVEAVRYTTKPYDTVWSRKEAEARLGTGTPDWRKKLDDKDLKSYHLTSNDPGSVSVNHMYILSILAIAHIREASAAIQGLFDENTPLDLNEFLYQTSGVDIPLNLKAALCADDEAVRFIIGQTATWIYEAKNGSTRIFQGNLPTDFQELLRTIAAEYAFNIVTFIRENHISVPQGNARVQAASVWTRSWDSERLGPKGTGYVQIGWQESAGVNLPAFDVNGWLQGYSPNISSLTADRIQRIHDGNSGVTYIWSPETGVIGMTSGTKQAMPQAVSTSALPEQEADEQDDLYYASCDLWEKFDGHYWNTVTGPHVPWLAKYQIPGATGLYQINVSNQGDEKAREIASDAVAAAEEERAAHEQSQVAHVLRFGMDYLGRYEGFVKGGIDQHMVDLVDKNARWIGTKC